MEEALGSSFSLHETSLDSGSVDFKDSTKKGPGTKQATTASRKSCRKKTALGRLQTQAIPPAPDVPEPEDASLSGEDEEESSRRGGRCRSVRDLLHDSEGEGTEPTLNQPRTSPESARDLLHDSEGEGSTETDSGRSRSLDWDGPARLTPNSDCRRESSASEALVLDDGDGSPSDTLLNDLMNDNDDQESDGVLTQLAPESFPERSELGELGSKSHPSTQQRDREAEKTTLEVLLDF